MQVSFLSFGGASAWFPLANVGIWGFIRSQSVFQEFSWTSGALTDRAAGPPATVVVASCIFINGQMAAGEGTGRAQKGAIAKMTHPVRLCLRIQRCSVENNWA